MVWPRTTLNIFIVVTLSSLTAFFSIVHADNLQPDRQRLREPVFRTPKTLRQNSVHQNHPLVPLLQAIRKSLDYSRRNIHDYSTTLVKREQVESILLDHQFIYMKIRNERKDTTGRIKVPFSVYLNFLGPESLKGREVLWVNGQNKGQLYAHEGSGLVGLFSVWFDPNGTLAMKGQRYPIYQIGIENLLVELIRRTEKDIRKCPMEDFELQVIPKAQIDDRSCTCFQVKHRVRKPQYKFFSLRVFLDDEHNIPIRYVAWDWPERTNAEPRVIEEYTYTDLKLNPGYAKYDFDPLNKQYNF